MNENLIFISYRRTDTSPHSFALRLELERSLKASSVFLDTQTIRPGQRWPDYIESALASASLVLVVIGPLWLGSDGKGDSRIEDPKDWVRREVAFALSQKPSRVLPIYVDDALEVVTGKLPSDLRPLADIQGSALRLEHWTSDIAALMKVVTAGFGHAGKTASYQFPAPDPLKAKANPIAWDRLQNEVLAHMADWTVEFSDDPNVVDHKRIELTRTFVFNSFEQAFSFMNVVAKHSTEIDHHPRWLNLWKSVTIWLSTWDAGHRVTDLDVQFARLIDRCHRDVQQGR